MKKTYQESNSCF